MNDDDKATVLAGIIIVMWILVWVAAIGLAGYGVFYLIDRALDIWASK